MTAPGGAGGQIDPAALGGELRQLRSLVQKLTTQQQTLVSTVRHLSDQLEDALKAEEPSPPVPAAAAGQHHRTVVLQPGCS